MCRLSFLVLVLLTRDQPADAVRSQDGVQSKARDEEDGEDQQPVDAVHRGAGEGTQVVCVRHVPVRASFKSYSGKLNHTLAKRGEYTKVEMSEATDSKGSKMRGHLSGW